MKQCDLFMCFQQFQAQPQEHLIRALVALTLTQFKAFHGICQEFLNTKIEKNKGCHPSVTVQLKLNKLFH